MPHGRRRRSSSGGEGTDGGRCREEDHGTQVVRALMWCDDQLHGAQLAKRSCHQFATIAGRGDVTALHIAAAKGWNKVCVWLLRQGSDVNAEDSISGHTPLHYALRTGQLHTAVLLNKKGAKWSHLSRFGDAPCHHVNIHYEDQEAILRSSLDDDLMTADQLDGMFEYLQTRLEADTYEENPRRKRGKGSTPSSGPLTRRSRNFAFHDSQAMPHPVEEVVCLEEESARPSRCSNKDKKWTGSNSSLLYVWGENDSYNLGLGSAKHYERPTLLESLSRGPLVTAVSLSKHHTLALTETGTVKVWGHGFGGRLGTGTDATSVRPDQVVFPQGIKISKIAAGADHSIFLSDKHEVFVCGLNQHFQLGIDGLTPNDSILSPQRVKLRLCGGDCRYTDSAGVACSRYHSVAWCGQDLYTWGTNFCQLGHPEDTVPTPRRVSNHPLSGIRGHIAMVSTCEIATVVVTSNARILILNRNGISDINCRFSPDMLPFRQLQVYGDAPQDKPLRSSGGGNPTDQLCADSWRQDTTLLILTKGGALTVWRQTSNTFEVFNAQNSWRRPGEGSPVDVAMCPNGKEVLLVTSKGELRRCSLLRKKGFKDDGQHSPITKMMPGIHRCCKINADPHGNNYAVITTDSFSEKQMPHFEEVPSLCADLARLQHEAALEDTLHDVILECGGKRYPAHKVILASRSNYFKELFSSSITESEKGGIKELGGNSDEGTQQKGKFAFSCGLSNAFVQASCLKQGVATPHVVNLDSIGPEALEEILTYMYTGQAEWVCKPLIKCSLTTDPLAKVLESGEIFLVYSDDEDNDLGVDFMPIPNREFSSIKEYRKLVTRVEKAAKFLKIANLFRSTDREPSGTPLFVAGSPPDMQFQAPDGTLGPCAHKCVLATRAAFFEPFFSSRWAQQEPSGPEGRQLLSTPHCHSAALPLLLQYFYSDKICSCEVTLPLALELIVLADEWLCSGAKCIAEKLAAQHISQRNFVSMYNVACSYNADTLRSCLLSYAAYNAPALMESRILENVTKEDLEKVSIIFSNCCFSFDTPLNNDPGLEVGHYYLFKDGQGTEHVSVPDRETLSYAQYKQLKQGRDHTTNIFRYTCPPLGYCSEMDPLLWMKMEHWDFYSVYMEGWIQVQRELDEEPYQLEEALPCPSYGPLRRRRHSVRSSSESQDDETPTYGGRGKEATSLDLSGLSDRYQEDVDDDWQLVRRKNTAGVHYLEAEPVIPTEAPTSLISSVDIGHSSSNLNAGPQLEKLRQTSACDSGPSSLPSTNNRSHRTAAPVSIPGSGEKLNIAAKKNMSPSIPASPDDAIRAAPASTFLAAQGSAAAGPVSPAEPCSFPPSSSAPEDEFPSLASSVAAAKLQLKPVVVKTSPFPKTSQKQRKRQRKEEEEPCAEESAVTPAAPAWGAVDGGADLQQSESDFPVLQTTAGVNTAGRRKGERTISGSSSGPPESTSPQKTCSTGHDFSKIMMEERTMDDNLNKSHRTSLNQIQMEEAAIAELYRHYRLMAGPQDEIKVVRAPSQPQALPSWTDKHRPNYFTS